MWNIITDSSSDLFDLEQPAENIRFATVPFVISVGDAEFVDDESLDVPTLVDAMARCKSASHTACPAPGTWLEAFGEEGDVIVVTISSHLSGSYNSACAAMEMLREQAPDRRVAVIDSLSTGPEMCLIVRRLRACIEEGMDFDAVVAEARRGMEDSRIIFSLSSYNNLIKNGRMHRIVGLAAHTLNLWGVGIGSPEGEIAFRKMTRGSKRAVEVIVHDMKERSGTVDTVVIDHCVNPEFAEKLRAAVLAEWPAAAITVRQTRGLCSYYAEQHGVIVGYSGGKPEAAATSHLHHITELLHTAARNIRGHGE